MTSRPAAPPRVAPLVPALLAAAILLFVLYKIAEIVMVAFIATLLAVYLGTLTNVLVRRVKVPRGIGLLLALALTTACLAGIAALLAPAVAQQTQDLIQSVPRYLTALDAFASTLVTRYPVLQRTGIASPETGVVSSLLAAAADFGRREVLNYATISGRVVIEAIAVMVMALYLAYRPAIYTNGIVSLVPPRHRDSARAILGDIRASLTAWVGAQLLAMVVLAVLTGVGLWLLNVPFWLAFSMFTGLLVMIPFFGTMISTLLPALLVLGDRGFLAFLAVASVGVVIHVIEANFVHPIIMHQRMQLPPVLTILSVLVMAKLGGLLGLLVAVPTLAIVVVLVRHMLTLRTYGDFIPVAAGALPDSRVTGAFEIPTLPPDDPPRSVTETAPTGDESPHA